MVQPRQEFLGSITELDRDTSGTVEANDTNLINLSSSLYSSRTSAPTTGSKKGSFWIDNNSPTLPKFTDSDGTTFTLGNAHGPAGGDLDGYYPDPNVISATFNGELISFDETIADGYILQRYGNSIIGIDPSTIIGPGYPVGEASGDLDGYYPSPTVIAAQFDTDRLIFSSVDDGYVLTRSGTEIIGLSVDDILKTVTADGYAPVHEKLNVTILGQTSFEMTYDPYDEWVEFFISGIKQEITDYTVNGKYIIWNGSYTITTLDIIEVVYSRIFNFVAASTGTITPTGSAGGDLDGYYPDPEVVAGQFNGTRLSFGTISEGQVLIRNGTSIIGISEFTPGGEASGDLDGYYPSPTVVAAQFDTDRLTLGFVNNGQALVRNGNSIIGADYVIPGGEASGDLDGYYPSPTVVAAQFDTDRLTFETTTDGQYLKRIGTTIVSSNITSGSFNSSILIFGEVNDGETLIRSGHEIISSSGVIPGGEASGDLDGYYPSPTVIAAQFDADRLIFSAIADNRLLQRSGDYIIGVSSDNLELTGDVTGTLSNSIVGSALFNSETLFFNEVEDGYVLQRSGTDIIGLDISDLLAQIYNDGYVPINETLPVNITGQTDFTLIDIPFNNTVLLFINGIKQPVTDFSITGTTLIYTGRSYTIQTTDVVEVSYFKLIIDGGGFIIEGQTLAGVLNTGNTTNGHDIILTTGDYITAENGTLTIEGSFSSSSDGYVGGHLEVFGNIIGQSLALYQQSSNPNPGFSDNVLWIRNTDKNVIVSSEISGDGYDSILQRKIEFEVITSATQTETMCIFDFSEMDNASIAWLKLSFISYVSSNPASKTTYVEQIILIRRGYSNDYFIMSNEEMFKTGIANFTINSSVNGNGIVTISSTNNEVSDQLYFSGYYEIGNIK